MLRFLAARQIHGQHLHLSLAEIEAVRAQFHQNLLSLRDKAAEATNKTEIHNHLSTIEICLDQLHSMHYQCELSLARDILTTGTSAGYSFRLHTLTDLMQGCFANAEEGRLTIQCLANYYFSQPYSDERDPSNFFDFFFKYLIIFRESVLQITDIIDLHRVLYRDPKAHAMCFARIANIHITYNNRVIEVTFRDGKRPLSAFLPSNHFYGLFFAVEAHNQLLLKHQNLKGSRANTQLFATRELTMLHQQLISILDDYIADKNTRHPLSKEEIELFDALAYSIYSQISEKAKTIRGAYQNKRKSLSR